MATQSTRLELTAEAAVTTLMLLVSVGFRMGK